MSELSKDARDHILTLDHENIIKMFGKPGDYQPEALLLAEETLRSRLPSLDVGGLLTIQPYLDTLPETLRNCVIQEAEKRGGWEVLHSTVLKVAEDEKMRLKEQDKQTKAKKERRKRIIQIQRETKGLPEVKEFQPINIAIFIIIGQVILWILFRGGWSGTIAALLGGTVLGILLAMAINALLLGASALAKPNAWELIPLQSWTLSKDSQSFQARLVDCDAQTAILRREDTGQETMIPLSVLSADDLEYIEGIRKDLEGGQAEEGKKEAELIETRQMQLGNETLSPQPVTTDTDASGDGHVSRGTISTPSLPSITKPQELASSSELLAKPGSGASRIVTGLLAIFLGTLGIHKFIMGYRLAGGIMLGASILGFIICGVPTLVMAIVGVIEGIIYLSMNDNTFKLKYKIGKKAWF